MKRKRIVHIICVLLCLLGALPASAQDCGMVFESIKELYEQKNWKATIVECKSYLRNCGSNAQVEQMLKDSEAAIKPKPPVERRTPSQTISSVTSSKRFIVDKTYVEFSDSGGQEQILVTSDEAWDVYDYPSWVDVERRNNSLLIICSTNFYSSAREEDIVLVNDNDKELRVTVSQDKSKYYLRLSSNSLYEKKGDGRTYLIDVSSNVSWYVKDKPYWCNVETKENLLKIKLERNKTGYEREGVIEISANQSTMRSLYFIKQGTLDNYIILTYGTINDEKGKGGTWTIPVDTDHRYYYFEGLPSWCEIIEKNASSFTVMLNDNSGGTAREAQCRVIAGDQYETLKIKQGARLSYVNISPNRVTATNRGGTISIYVDSSSAWRVVNLPSWCQVSGVTQSSFKLLILPNDGSPRTATFSVSSSGIKENILVEQQ